MPWKRLIEHNLADSKHKLDADLKWPIKDKQMAANIVNISKLSSPQIRQAAAHVSMHDSLHPVARFLWACVGLIVQVRVGMQRCAAGWDELMVDGTFPGIESHAAFKLKGSTFEIRRNRFEDPIPFTGEAKNWKEATLHVARFATHHAKMMPCGGFFRDGTLNCDCHSDVDLDIRVPREVGRQMALGTLKSWGSGCGVEHVCQGMKLEEHTFRCSSDVHVFNVQLTDWNAFQEQDGKCNLDFTANAFCAMKGKMLSISWRNPMVEEGQVIDDMRNEMMRPCKPVVGDELMEARAARFSRGGWTMMDYTWDSTGLHQIRDEGSTT
eukprot:jgi/Bigna1/80246/fgenesh1_pg.69_\